KGAPPEGGAIDWVECPADALQVDSDAYDVVVCQQGLQFFPDKPAALREMRRAVRDGGRVGIACWAPIDTQPMFAAMARALESYLGDDGERGYRAGPWGLTDADELGRLVEGAGFSEVRVEQRLLPVRFDDAVAQLITMASFMPVGEQLKTFDDARCEAFVR